MNNIINRPLHRCLPKDVHQERYIRRVRAASHADLRKTETRQLQIRSFARKADERCSNRMVMRGIKKNPPSVYRVGERVLVRLKDAPSKVTKHHYCVECDIIRRNVKLAQYEVQFVCPTTRQKQTKWKSVANITSLTSYEEKRRRTIRQRHRDTYYLPVGSTGEMDWLDNHDFSVRYNPEPNENCQFEAIADQLSRFGILRSAHTLRAEIVRDIGRCPYLRDGSSLTNFLNNEDLISYLRAMIQDGTHGDHITLQRCTVIFNVQFIVLSSLGPTATSIISATGRYDENIPTLFLAHLREGRGEHYLSIEGSDEGVARVISLFDRGGSDNRNDELTNEHGDNGRALIDRGDRREVVEMERDDSEDEGREGGLADSEDEGREGGLADSEDEGREGGLADSEDEGREGGLADSEDEGREGGLADSEDEGREGGLADSEDEGREGGLADSEDEGREGGLADSEDEGREGGLAHSEDEGMEGGIADSEDEGREGGIADSEDEGSEGGIADSEDEGREGGIADSEDEGSEGGIADSEDEGREGGLADSEDEGREGGLADSEDEGREGGLAHSEDEGMEGGIADSEDEGREGGIADSEDEGSEGGIADSEDEGREGGIADSEDEGSEGGIADSEDEGREGGLADSEDEGREGGLADSEDEGREGGLADSEDEGREGGLADSEDEGREGGLADSEDEGREGGIADSEVEGSEGGIADSEDEGREGGIADSEDEGREGGMADSEDEGREGGMADSEDEGSEGGIADSEDEGSEGGIADSEDEGREGGIAESEDEGREGGIADSEDEGSEGGIADSEDEGSEGGIADSEDEGREGGIADSEDEGREGGIADSEDRGAVRVDSVGKDIDHRLVDDKSKVDDLPELDDGDDDRITTSQDVVEISRSKTVHRRDDGDDHDLMSNLPLFPNEIFSHIILMTLACDFTMLGTINRVCVTFRELAAHHLTNRFFLTTQLHISPSLAEALHFDSDCDTTLSVRRLMRQARPGSGVASRVRELLRGNPQWYNAWLTLAVESFGWYRVTDIFWRRR